MKKLFLNVETTGQDPTKHSIHQITGIIEIEGLIDKEFNFFTRPHPKSAYEESALKYCGKTQKELEAYRISGSAYKALTKILMEYVDIYNPKDKIFIVGYNNRSFADVFFRIWFTHNNSQFFGSYFWPDSLDTLVLASQYLLERRSKMPSFQLQRVAKEIGLEVDDSKIKDPEYKVNLIRDIYRIVTNLETEL